MESTHVYWIPVYELLESRGIEVVLVDYDETLGDFKDNFDPNIVDKTKLLTLVNYLHVQVNSISDEAVRTRLTTKLADLEAEIRKPRFDGAL